jgi:hypothetical protein
VKDDRYDGEDQQQVDQETRGVNYDETADPCQDQNKRNDQKHSDT